MKSKEYYLWRLCAELDGKLFADGHPFCCVVLSTLWESAPELLERAAEKDAGESNDLENALFRTLNVMYENESE